MPGRRKMTEVKVTKARVERSGGTQEPIHDLSITAKQCAIIDFVGQLCKEYDIPHNRGLNIRYTAFAEFRIQVSVEVLSTLAPTTIEFLAQKSQASYGWEIYTPNNFPVRILPQKQQVRVFPSIDGKYSFMPSGRNLRLGCP